MLIIFVEVMRDLIESGLNLIPKCRGSSNDVKLVKPVSNDFSDQWFMISICTENVALLKSKTMFRV